MTDAAVPTIDNLLIRGRDYLEKTPGFKLEGRAEELKEMMTQLMLKDNGGILLTGSSGVGMSALVRGLQTAKSSPDTPIDIVNKRFFWLDADELFASGDSADVNTKFKRIRAVLAETPNTCLVVENMGNLVESASKTGNTHILNGIFGDIKRGAYQAILECQYEDLGKVLKTDADAQSVCTIYEVKEPKKENLRSIVMSSKKGYEDFHGIRVSEEAVDTALQLTAKYKLRSLPAQPLGTLKIINSALAEYRLEAHSHPFKLTELEAQLKAVEESIATGVNAPSLRDKSANELASMRETLKSDIAEFTAAWEKRHKEIASVSRDQRDAEDRIRSTEVQIAELQAREKANNDAIRAGQGDQPSGEFNNGARKGSLAEGIHFDTMEGVDSQEVLNLKQKIDTYRQLAAESAAKYQQMTAEINKDLILTADHVLKAFSKLSGISASKLTQNDRDKLVNLEGNLNNRVFGQEQAIEAVAGAVKIARAGLSEPNQPEFCMLFLGPSGTGKTELTRSLAMELNDDPDAMVRLDMSEYQEKQAVARLIGAPPGYAGYEEGGQLTNAVHRDPGKIVLADEVEKAHKDVFDVFLALMSNGKVTDGKGVVVDFRQTKLIMTSNIGSEHFLNPELTYEQAREKAIEDLIAHGFRPEFLNRFNGRQNIIGFRKLEMPSIIRIGLREVDKLRDQIKDRGLNIDMNAQDITALCEDYYTPAEGARGIPGVFTNMIKRQVADFIIANPGKQGILHLGYQSNQDKDGGTASLSFTEQTAAPAVAAPALKI